MKIDVKTAQVIRQLDSFVRANYIKGKILPGLKNIKIVGYKFGDIQVPEDTDLETMNIIARSYNG